MNLCKNCGLTRYAHKDHAHLEVNANGRCQFGCCGKYEEGPPR